MNISDFISSIGLSESLAGLFSVLFLEPAYSTLFILLTNIGLLISLTILDTQIPNDIQKLKGGNKT